MPADVLKGGIRQRIEIQIHSKNRNSKDNGLWYTKILET
jgi:hypothetical protein